MKLETASDLGDETLTAADPVSQTILSSLNTSNRIIEVSDFELTPDPNSTIFLLYLNFKNRLQLTALIPMFQIQLPLSNTIHPDFSISLMAAAPTV